MLDTMCIVYSSMSTKKQLQKFKTAGEAQHSLEEAAKQKQKYQEQLDTKFLAEKSEFVEAIVKSVGTKPPPKPKAAQVGRGKLSTNAMIDRN